MGKELPSKVKIGPFEYTVERADYVIIEGSANYSGSQNGTHQRIQIMKEGHPEYLESILCHEIIHAMLDLAGVQDHSEDLVKRLTNPFYQFLKDNTNYFGDEPDREITGRKAKQVACGVCDTTGRSGTIYGYGNKAICDQCLTRYDQIMK